MPFTQTLLASLDIAELIILNTGASADFCNEKHDTGDGCMNLARYVNCSTISRRPVIADNNDSRISQASKHS